MGMSDVLEGRSQWWIECDDVLAALARIPSESVHCVITSGDTVRRRVHAALVRLQGAKSLVKSIHLRDGALGHAGQSGQPDMLAVGAIGSTHGFYGKDQLGLFSLEDQIWKYQLQQRDGNRLGNVSTETPRAALIDRWVLLVAGAEPMANRADRFFGRNDERKARHKARRSATNDPLLLAFKTCLGIDEAGQVRKLGFSKVQHGQ